MFFLRSSCAQANDLAAAPPGNPSRKLLISSAVCTRGTSLGSFGVLTSAAGFVRVYFSRTQNLKNVRSAESFLATVTFCRFRSYSQLTNSRITRWSTSASGSVAAPGGVKNCSNRLHVSAVVVHGFRRRVALIAQIANKFFDDLFHENITHSRQSWCPPILRRERFIASLPAKHCIRRFATQAPRTISLQRFYISY